MAPDAGLFPATRWTRVLAAREQPALRREVLGELLQGRWKALYVVARKKGLQPAEAEDAVQSFVERLLDSDLLARLDPGRGRLRAYLRTALAHHLANLHEQAAAAKRGGGQRAAALDDVEALLASPAATPEQLFDRAWAQQLFDDALGALDAEVGQERDWARPVLRAAFGFDVAVPYPELAERFGLTVPQIKSFVFRAKARFEALLRARIADTVCTSDEIDDELRALLQALAS